MSGEHTRLNGSWKLTVAHKQMGNEYDTDEEDGEMKTVDIDPNAPVGKVGVNIGMTLNLGNYESAKMDVYVSLPFDASKDGAGQGAYDECYEFAQTKIQDVKKDITGDPKADAPG